MSRLARLASLFTVMSGCCALSNAQTIADYSRSQRAIIEAAISRNAARSTAPPSQAALPAMPSVSAPQQGIVVAAPAPVESEAEVTVTGVIVAAGTQLAEVEVDGAPYMLAAGQDVPGTRWRVERIGAERVVLADPARRSRSRSFTLAAMGR